MNVSYEIEKKHKYKGTKYKQTTSLKKQHLVTKLNARSPNPTLLGQKGQLNTTSSLEIFKLTALTVCFMPI